MKKRALANPDAIIAARELIKAQRERLGADPDGVTTIVTGVPRPGDGIDWKAWMPPAPKSSPPAIKPKAPVATEPKKTLPVEWKWFCVQTGAPSDRNPQGVIAEGFYGISDGVVYVEDMRSNPLGSQHLRSDDNPQAVARKILKDRRRTSSVPGFYDGAPYNPNRVFH